MPDGNSASVDVEFVAVEAKLALAGENLRSEGLIDFEAIDLWQTQASQAQQGLNCRHRSDAHNLWADANHRPGHDSRQGVFLVLLQATRRRSEL